MADEQHWARYDQLKKANKQQHEVIVALKGKLKVQQSIEALERKCWEERERADKFYKIAMD